MVGVVSGTAVPYDLLGMEMSYSTRHSHRPMYGAVQAGMKRKQGVVMSLLATDQYQASQNSVLVVWICH